MKTLIGEKISQKELRKAGKKAPPPQKPIPSSQNLATLVQAIQKDSRDLMLIHNVVKRFISSERYEGAIKHIKSAIILYPEVANLQFLLGATYCKARRYKESLAPLRLAVRLNPKFAKAHYYLWMVHELVGIEQDGHKHYKIATTLNPDIGSEETFTSWTH